MDAERPYPHPLGALPAINDHRWMNTRSVAAHPPADPDQYARSVRRVLWGTLALNIGVCLLKLIVGLWTGSLAIMADAIHSLTDSLNNVMGLVVMRWSAPPPDREHPYGHLKFEAIGALGIAAMLGIACFEVVKPAVMRLIDGDRGHVTMNATAIGLMGVVLLVNIGVAWFERRAGLRLHSKLLLADAAQTFGDIWITLGVIALKYPLIAALVVIDLLLVALLACLPLLAIHVPGVLPGDEVRLRLLLHRGPAAALTSQVGKR